MVKQKEIVEDNPAVICHNYGGTLHVLVHGGLAGAGELALFEQAIAIDTPCIEISFIDARMLPAIVIEHLYKLVERYDRNSIRIYTFHKSLHSYLLRFKINTILVDNLANTRTSGQEAKGKPIKAIALGGSSGSFEKIVTFLHGLPLADVTVFIVQHLMEGKKSIIAEIYQKETLYNVVMPKDGTLIQNATVYVAPPSYHMIVIGNFIYLTKGDRVNHARPSIDVLLGSLAAQYGEELLAVLFCGYGHDGTSSLATLRALNATVIIESPQECEAKNIPLNAIETASYTSVLTSPEIISFVRKSLQEEEDISEDELVEFLRSIHEVYGYNFADYNRDSILRRIKSVISSEHYSSFSEFKMAAIANTTVFSRLFLALSINYTTFFRTPAMFKVLKETVFPYLNTYHHIKIWCAGVSSGEEPYSLAILLHEAKMLHKTQIYATDFNQVVLWQARNGLFPVDGYHINERDYLEAGGALSLKKYFNFYGTFMKINDFLMEKILFFTHNLVTDSVFNEFQLIICRNVLIYFNPLLQEKTLKMFSDSLCISGFLILGESEGLLINYGDKYFKNYDLRNRIYRKMVAREMTT